MLKKRKPLKVQKYILTFFIVTIIFALGFLMSDYLNDKRFIQIERARQELQIQIMGMETQLAHFRDILCPDIGKDILTHELHLIGEKLQFMANSLGKDHPEVIHLKKHYAILQIRHYQFSKELNQRCNLELTHILYFYADEKNCPDCEKQGHILTNLRRDYPNLRIYSFDYKLKLPALAIIKPITPAERSEAQRRREGEASPSIPLQEKELEENNEDRPKDYLPIIVVNEKPFFGFQDLEEMKKLLQLE